MKLIHCFKLLLYLMLCSSAFQSLAAIPDTIEKEGGPEIWVRSEVMPKFPGGQDSLTKFIESNLVYPAELKDVNIAGTVRVRFIVDEMGNVREPIVLTSDNALLDQAAIDVISKLPRWTPGSQLGEKVQVYIMIPIDFKP